MAKVYTYVTNLCEFGVEHTASDTEIASIEAIGPSFQNRQPPRKFRFSDKNEMMSHLPPDRRPLFADFVKSDLPEGHYWPHFTNYDPPQEWHWIAQ